MAPLLPFQRALSPSCARPTGEDKACSQAQSSLSEAVRQQLKIDSTKAEKLKQQLTKNVNARRPLLFDLQTLHTDYLKLVKEAKKLQNAARPFLRKGSSKK